MRRRQADLLTPDEAAIHLRITRKALYLRVQRGQVRAYHLGRQLRFRRQDLDALLDPVTMAASAG